jgi:hypothetical protein
MFPPRPRPALSLPRALVLPCSIAIAAALLMGPNDAWARSSRVRARAEHSSALDSARRAAKAGHLDTAIAEYKSAYQKFGEPRLLFELGELHLRSGRLPEARRFYDVYLQHDPPAKGRVATEERVREIELARVDLDPAAASAAPPPAAGAVAFTTTPPPVDFAAPTPQPAAPAPTATFPAAPPPPRPTPPLVASTALLSPAPSTTLVAGPQTAGGASMPIPPWVPVFGAAVTGGLLAGALVGGHLANQRNHELQQACGMTDAGCPPERVSGLRSLARMATTLWIATAVAGTGTGIAILLDARAVGLSNVWSF